MASAQIYSLELGRSQPKQSARWCEGQTPLLLMRHNTLTIPLDINLGSQLELTLAPLSQTLASIFPCLTQTAKRGTMSKNLIQRTGAKVKRHVQ
eukprot:scaffold5901_cov116-Cylindrotheca_fusiformis.AAC.9